MMPIQPSVWISYSLAVITGFAFGFILERAGFGSAKRLVAQFYLKDMSVLKVMFTAIVTALLGMTVLRALGLVDYDEIYINPTYLQPQIVGGLIFGLGFVLGGYCPGTAVVGAINGRLDALAFLFGIGGGVLGFSAAYPAIGSFATKGSGGRELLTDWLHLPYGVVAVLVTVMAVAMFFGAEYIERRMAKASTSEQPLPRSEPTNKQSEAVAN